MRKPYPSALILSYLAMGLQRSDPAALLVCEWGSNKEAAAAAYVVAVDTAVACHTAVAYEHHP